MDVQGKIHRAGRIIDRLCGVLRVLLLVGAVVGFVGAVVLFAGLDSHDGFFAQATQNAIFQALSYGDLLGGIPRRHVLAIQAFTFAMVQMFLLHILGLFRGLVGEISRGETVFKVSTGKRLRDSLWQVAVLFLWHPVFAAIVLVFALLVSYLIDYGAYLQERAAETSRIQEQMIVQFAEITENKSGQTGSHIKRVSEYSRVLADEMGLSPERVEQVRLASTMHDIGKLLIPSQILDKPGRLTDEEYAVIKLHTTYGGQLLEGVEGEVMQLSRTIALDHHERWDGAGYAQGKAGEQISLEGRIVAVADVYDALTSRRSYKDAWDDRKAYDEIVRCSGTQFDPTVVAAFERRYADIDTIRRDFQD